MSEKCSNNGSATWSTTSESEEKKSSEFVMVKSTYAPLELSESEELKSSFIYFEVVSPFIGFPLALSVAKESNSSSIDSKGVTHL